MNQSPTPIEVKANMDFPDALREVIAGKKVARLEWEDKGVYFFMDEFLSIHKADGNPQLILSKADLLSDDYVII